ncbi:MAG: hypothetical protein IT285_02405 [Bdellovibrionales bacterium]|nr:hypothetical protein [Bdellovibrionales bacterium]
MTSLFRLAGTTAAVLILAAAPVARADEPAATATLERDPAATATATASPGQRARKKRQVKRVEKRQMKRAGRQGASPARKNAPRGKSAGAGSGFVPGSQGAPPAQGSFDKKPDAGYRDELPAEYE